ncbi:DUF2147 domain-containing protein [Robertkochia marina]|uniref:DUF2147 domain-containing protein n=1 Tax=Robertkochia marina TaxID=1227945 RepID=A0A4S3LZI1_9FLAO|nr:DUF2147 domain-containing protein [Robertkochia marina]THD67491.1 DUF2147 domain-containing protein [Robertkochia marina]TRZ44643.1 DUF2147 domain-containing protein [Robertkochia marina]
MKKRVFSSLLCLGLFIGGLASANAQSVFGKWKTIDDETGDPKSIVEIYEEGGQVYGKIVEILNKDRQDAKCTECDGENKDKPILGMVIIEGLEKEDDAYEGGTILDPNKGKEYKCKIWVDEDNNNKLNVRGYIAFLFRTQEWFRVK